MADLPPSNPVFRLPENVDALARMRDELSDYLNTLERNTDSVNGWLNDNRVNVIVGHHHLMRAITQEKSETSALAVLSALGDMAGFVLSMQDFTSLAEKNFGPGNTFAKKTASISLGIPEKILEELPALRAPTKEELKAAPVETIVPTAEELEAARRKWWSPGSWFGKTEEELHAEAEAESLRKINEIKRHWGLVKTELVALQSDRHYYVDSFMDWVADTLQPEDFTKTESQTARVMDTYQNPQYIIDLAHEDYGKVIHGKALALRDQALNYSQMAALIDAQKIADFIKMLPKLFPETETFETDLAKKLLLKDFGVASFAELALDKVKNRAEQLSLLEAVLRLEPAFTLTKEKTEPQIFARILAEVTADKNPLNTHALTVTLNKFKPQGGFQNGLLAQIAGIGDTQKTVFEKLAARFDSDLPAFKKALGDLAKGMQENPQTIVLTEFIDAVRQQDDAALHAVFRKLNAASQSLSFQALWEMTYPNISLVGEIKKTAKDVPTLALLMEGALSAGLLDELRINTGAAFEKPNSFAAFAAEKIIPAQDEFSLAIARKLMAAVYANGGLDTLRDALTAPDGWLEKTMIGTLPDAQKIEWIAALLEPFSSDIVKANILNEAAQKAQNTDAAKTLAQMEENFSGADVRLSDDKIMTNLDKIANIWYSAEAQVMHYTTNGTGHIFLEDVSPVMAAEVLSLLQRKGGFLSEYDGLFKPENIDRITTDPQGSKVTWYRHSGNLNVAGADLDALHARKDFIHEQNKGRRQSINQKSIALLQPLEDGSWLLVDKYGAVEFLEGTVTLAPQAPLIDLGGTYFNPENASIISLDADKNKLNFRLESRDFDDLLQRAAPSEYFYGVDLQDAAAFTALETAVRKANGVFAPDEGDLGSMFFNLKKLGYMMFMDDRETGFNCHKFSPAKKPGFIQTEEEMAQSIFAGLSAQKDIVTVGSLLTHKDNIDDAYYNTDKSRFYMVVGSDLLQVDCTETEAYDALKKLAKTDGFSVVGANDIQNSNGKGTVEVPADIINLKNATLLFNAPTQDRTFVICDNEKFHISLDASQSRSLMDMMADKGFEKTRANTPKNAAWVKSLKTTLAVLPAVFVPVTQPLTARDSKALLSIALGTQDAAPRLPQAQADFSIAATAPIKLEVGKTISYPARKRRAPTP